MVLSRADKLEIAAMLEQFSYRMGPGAYVSPQHQLIEQILGEIQTRGLPVAQALEQRMMASPGIQMPGSSLIDQLITTAIVPTKRKKAMTKFNRAVKEGMKIVRKSSSYGKKGAISNSKKAFSAVTKTVAKARKGGKIAAKGVLRKVALKAKQILGKRKPGTYILGKRIKTY